VLPLDVEVEPPPEAEVDAPPTPLLDDTKPIPLEVLVLDPVEPVALEVWSEPQDDALNPPLPAAWPTPPELPQAAGTRKSPPTEMTRTELVNRIVTLLFR